jgi:hypothetical protein
MRTERRQDLRTNELSHQLDAVRDYARKNATLLTIIVVVAAVVVGASLAYAKWQNDRRAEAWDAVDSAGATGNPAKAIDSLEEVAARNVSPAVTKAALLRIGETALRQSTIPSTDPNEVPGAAPTTGKPIDWAAKAHEAYTEIKDRFRDDKVAMGQALIALGVLAENRGEIEKARALYKEAAADKGLLHTSLVAEADYRLAHLDQWSKPVVFPPPQMTVPIPEGKEAEAYTLPKEPVPAPAAAGGTAGDAEATPAPPGQASPPPATPDPAPAPGSSQ